MRAINSGFSACARTCKAADAAAQPALDAIQSGMESAADGGSMSMRALTVAQPDPFTSPSGVGGREFYVLKVAAA